MERLAENGKRFRTILMRETLSRTSDESKHFKQIGSMQMNA